MSEEQQTVVIHGLERKTSNPNAPYRINTDVGVFKVFDRDGAVTQLMGMVGRNVSLVYRTEQNTFTAREGPRAGQEITTTDRIVTSFVAGPAVPIAAGAPVAAPPASTSQAAAPRGGTWKPRSPEETAQIHRQTAVKCAMHFHATTVGVSLDEVVSTADDLCHYFEHGRLPEKMTDQQHKMMEALCANLDKLDPFDGYWRDRVKAQMSKSYGRTIVHLTDIRKDEAGQILDSLGARVEKLTPVPTVETTTDALIEKALSPPPEAVPPEVEEQLAAAYTEPVGDWWDSIND